MVVWLNFLEYHYLLQVYKILESSKYYGAFLNSTSYLKWVFSLFYSHVLSEVLVSKFLEYRAKGRSV